MLDTLSPNKVYFFRDCRILFCVTLLMSFSCSKENAEVSREKEICNNSYSTELNATYLDPQRLKTEEAMDRISLENCIQNSSRMAATLHVDADRAANIAAGVCEIKLEDYSEHILLSNKSQESRIVAFDRERKNVQDEARSIIYRRRKLCI